MSACNIGRGCDCFFTGCRAGITASQFYAKPDAYMSRGFASLRPRSGECDVSDLGVPGDPHMVSPLKPVRRLGPEVIA